MSKNHDILAIIPARYGSTRFPGKPLVKINGIMMIERVYRTAYEATCNVVVATEDRRIMEAVKSFGGKAVMTSATCRNGTDRVAEAYQNIGSNAKIVLNVQGDEPFIKPTQIKAVSDILVCNKDAEISTLALRFDPKEGFESLFDPNRVKLTMDANGRAMYFSRSIIPYVRDKNWQEWTDSTEYYIHLGLYGFRGDILSDIASLHESKLDRAENLEQLRWLYNGYKIYTAITDERTWPVDTPEDVSRISR